MTRAAAPPAALLHEAIRRDAIPGLDFLRALAIMLVLLGHAWDLSWIDNIASLGVQLFFVLSGFLITLLLLREWSAHRRIDLGRFFRRRAARLLPAFYLYALGMLAILALQGKDIPWQPVLAAMLYVVNYYQAFTGAHTNIVSHCWSLSLEEQFYLVWPIVLGLVLARDRRSRGRVMLVVAVILCVWVYRWWLIAQPAPDIDYLYRALETRADHLAMGCLTAILLHAGRVHGPLMHWLSHPWIWGALLSALFGLSVLDQHPTFKYAVGFMVEPVLAALLLVSTLMQACRNGWLGRLMNHRWPAHIGKVSYGMYLYHGIVMFGTERAVRSLTGSAVLGLVVAVAATIAIASLSFRWFESPLRARLAGPKPARPIAGAAEALRPPARS